MSRAQHIIEELISQEITNEVVNMLINHGSTVGRKLAYTIKKLGKAAYRDDVVGDTARYIKDKIIAAHNRGESLESAGAKRAFVREHVAKAVEKYSDKANAIKRRWAALGLAVSGIGLYGKYSGKFDPLERPSTPKGYRGYSSSKGNIFGDDDYSYDNPFDDPNLNVFKFKQKQHGGHF